MTIASLDYYAYHSHSIFARASVWAKLLLIVVVLSGIVIGSDIRFLLSLYVLALASLVIAAEQSFFELWIASLYPLVFAAILVLGLYGFNASMFLLIASKVLAASTIMIAVLATTPYPALFRALGFVITPLLSSIMMLTYRSFFLLVDIFTESYAMVRLRGGLTWSRPVASLKNLAHITALTLVRSIELAEVQYESMRLRGFSGRMHYTARRTALPSATFALLCLSAAIVGVAVLAYY